MLPAHDSRENRIPFGAFELDIETGRLLHSGSPVPLSPQAFTVLVLLIRSAKQLVTREELQEKVWGSAFVDSEQGLNRCIKQIRSALCDSAENPRYIETIRGRGYRILALSGKSENRPNTQQGLPGKPRKCLGISRFRNLSENPEQAWISTALSEMFITEVIIDGKLLSHSLEDQGAKSERPDPDWFVRGAYIVVGRNSHEHIRLDIRVQDWSGESILAAFSETDALSNLPKLVSRAGERLRETLDSEACRPT